MHLFINTLSTPATLILFSEDKKILSKYQWDAKGSEYETLVDSIEEICKNTSLSLKNITSITAVNGPGWFTSTRVIVLTVNTFAHSLGIPVYDIDFFSLLRLSKKSFPYAIAANRREYLLKENTKAVPKLIKCLDFAHSSISGAGNSLDFPKTVRLNTCLEISKHDVKKINIFK